MALTPWNRQEEWYQQMINASTGNYLPSISAQDAGKVMTVESDGSWGVENVPTELPSVSGTDDGKVLTVNNSGVWVAQNPSSGGGVLVVTDTDGTLDKTWQEIHAAMLSGGAVIQHDETEADAVLRARVGKGTYDVSSADGVSYSASSASGYPTEGGM